MMRTRTRSRWRTPLILACLGIFALPDAAWAYIDPGTGSMLYQAVLAALLGAAFTVRSARDWLMRTVRNLFASRRRSSGDSTSRDGAR